MSACGKWQFRRKNRKNENENRWAGSLQIWKHPVDLRHWPIWTSVATFQVCFLSDLFGLVVGNRQIGIFGIRQKLPAQFRNIWRKFSMENYLLRISRSPPEVLHRIPQSRPDMTCTSLVCMCVEKNQIGWYQGKNTLREK